MREATLHRDASAQSLAVSGRPANRVVLVGDSIASAESVRRSITVLQTGRIPSSEQAFTSRRRWAPMDWKLTMVRETLLGLFVGDKSMNQQHPRLPACTSTARMRWIS